jgi:hypothetical protein
MRKILVLVMVASLVTAGAAFAGTDNTGLIATPDATFAFGVGGVASGPSTTNNDDTCDISVAPAATLLLPYFEVETSATIDRSIARSTLFTITNVSNLNQVAKVTVWTDWSYPVLDFNIWLTPFDVQSINLRDIIVGVPGATGAPVPTIAPPSGTTSTAAAATVRAGANPNHVAGITAAGSACSGLFGAIPAPIAEAVRSALTTGFPPATSAFYCFTTAPPRTPLQIGNNHGTAAVGYLTIDVVNNCTTTLPTSNAYYSAPGEILFDNVLIGDYQDINTVAGRNDAGGSPLVHIRAIPEGGPAASVPVDALGAPATTNLPYTFYDRYTPDANRRIDRRQPLPSVFAARYIAGGTALFSTDFKIWREGLTGDELRSPTSGAGCEAATALTAPPGFTPPTSIYANNARLAVADMVRFDERENATTLAGVSNIISPAPAAAVNALPETSRVNIAAADTTPNITDVFTFPTPPSTDVGGWVYWNLNNGGNAGAAFGTRAYSSARAGFGAGVGTTTTGVRQSQNWVIVAMQANAVGAGQFSVDFDAAWLGNGCTPSPALATRGGLLVAGSNINPAGGTAASCVPGSAGCVNPNVTP